MIMNAFEEFMDKLTLHDLSIDDIESAVIIHREEWLEPEEQFKLPPELYKILKLYLDECYIDDYKWYATWLKPNYSGSEQYSFLEDLDIIYNDGLGAQELFGTVIFKDGSRFERVANNVGEEWWEYHISNRDMSKLISNIKE